MKFFVAGGLYWQDSKKVFKLVKPGHNSNPYVWPEQHPLGQDAACLGHLTQHHASLYEIDPSGLTLKLARMGECRQDPITVAIPPDDVAQVKNGMDLIAKALEALPRDPQ